jgi:hypothetical protein
MRQSYIVPMTFSISDYQIFTFPKFYPITDHQILTTFHHQTEDSPQITFSWEVSPVDQSDWLGRAGA